MSTQAPPPGAAADPSMEDILASIRRILSEDEAAPPEAAGTPPAVAAGIGGDEVLALDDSMLVGEPLVPIAAPEPNAAPASEPPAPDLPAPEPLATAAAEEPMTEPTPAPPAPTPVASRGPAEGPLIAPEAEAAAATAMGSLLRTLEQGREVPAGDATVVYRGGPTLEGMVREEIRPLLKSWLDTNLPPLVERLVRAEIARLAGRAVS